MKKLIFGCLMGVAIIALAAGCRSSNKESSFWGKNSKPATNPYAGQPTYPPLQNYQGAIVDPAPNMGTGGPPPVKDVGAKTR
jgi:hypothetical protein